MTDQIITMRIETDSLNKSFGGIKALDDVSVDFEPGMVTAIIGPNGAGKTTFFNVISGFLQPDSGAVYLLEDEEATGDREHDNGRPRNITGLKPHKISLLGIGVLFQDVRVFGKMTVLDNLLTAGRFQPGESPIHSVFTPWSARAAEHQLKDRAVHYLDYVGLSDKAHLWAEQLSYGQQKLAAIARLLVSDARVLLLDEPTSGVNPKMISKLLDLIQQLAESDGRTVIMIEHNLNIVREVGDWVYLMARGAIEVFGKPQEVFRTKSLTEAFPNL